MAQTSRSNPAIGGAVPTQYYPTPERVVDLIARYLELPRERRGGYEGVRMLDPCCGGGDALARLRERLGRPDARVETSGVELHQQRAEAAARLLDRVLWADLFNTTIARGVYSLAFVNPPYDFSGDEDVRMEQGFLRHTLDHLMPRGVLVFVLPRRRLRNSARFLASNFRHIQCYQFPEPEREAFDQVVLFGVKLERPVLDRYDMELIQSWSDGAEPLTPLATVYTAHYGLPLVAWGDTLFALRTVDPALAAQEARRSGLWASADLADALWPGDERHDRPLMPLRKGHLAQLVAAGALNNVPLEDAEGNRVLVKGRAEKVKLRASEDAEKEVYRETIMATVMVLDLASGVIDEIGAGDDEPEATVEVAVAVEEAAAATVAEPEVEPVSSVTRCRHCHVLISAGTRVVQTSVDFRLVYHAWGECYKAATRLEGRSLAAFEWQPPAVLAAA